MDISFDRAKQEWTLAERGLDFAEAAVVFRDVHFTLMDERWNYQELRYITIGHLRCRLVVLVWTPRNDGRRIISMRKANEREEKRFRSVLAGSGRGSGDHPGDA
ncbi:hypothetical protein CEK62_07800 [Alcanivorax sp. N3-2A]|nr:hypothetical protein CEK62_07800 [Alcanivorax sp. N3-2A]|tara:strand:- start:6202 stop:6513 length:312 start_codon:yes stop_codon:yes gene_type:complete